MFKDFQALVSTKTGEEAALLFIKDSLKRKKTIKERHTPKQRDRKARATQIGQCSNPILITKVCFLVYL